MHEGRNEKVRKKACEGSVKEAEGRNAPDGIV